LLERNKLGTKLVATLNEHLRRSGIKITPGTIVDATIIGAPSSTKNKDGKRNPEMHQTSKGKQWYFGMKAHVGVDSRTKLIHTVLASAANVADSLAVPHWLHGKETRVWGDQAYRGQKAAIRASGQGLHQPTVSLGRVDRRVDQIDQPPQVASAGQS
jgi:IS5 family transposase